MLGDRPSCDGSSSRSPTADQQQQLQPPFLWAATSPKSGEIGTLSGHILKTEHAQYRYPTVAVTMYLIFFDNWTSSEKQGFTHMGVSFLDNPTHLPSALCPFPLKHAWGNLDAPIGRLRAAYEEHRGSPDTNPFGNGAIRTYLRELECRRRRENLCTRRRRLGL